MAKLTYDQAVENLTTAKASLKEAREGLRLFKKEKELKGDAEPKSAKDKKQLKSFNASIDKLVKERDSLQASVKELKPKKERIAKYEYPQVEGKGGKKRDMDDKEKKKFRTAQRNLAKKALKESEKGEKKGKKSKKDKSSKTETSSKKKMKTKKSKKA